MRCRASVVAASVLAALVAAPAGAIADEPKVNPVAEKFNDQGRDLFGNGELEEAISKFRAAIAVDPQARYFFNLCFVLNARYQLDAALGACQAVAGADGADDRLKQRAADLIEVIEKKRAEGQTAPKSGPRPEPIKVTDENGEPVLESKPLPADIDKGSGEPDRPPERVASATPRRYPPPIARGTPPAGVRIVSEPAPPPRKYHIGLIAGFSFAHIEAESDDGVVSGSSGTVTGFTGGGFVSTSLSRVFVGQVEVVYLQRGAGSGNGIDDAEDVSLDYLSIPVIGKVQLPLGRSKIHLDLGFDLSFLVNSSANAGDPGFVDAGFVVGGGMTFHRPGHSALIFDLRHESGFTNVIDVDAVAGFENRTWTLRVGYGF